MTSIEKRIPYRNQRLLDMASGMPCMNCGRMDGTTVACHYQGDRANAFGKGIAQKPDDDCVAFLCGRCHKAFDGYENAPSGTFEDPAAAIDRSEQFLFCVVRTMNLLHRIGFDFSTKAMRERA